VESISIYLQWQELVCERFERIWIEWIRGLRKGPENMNTSHQSSGLYTGSQLHLGLILKYYYWYINYSLA